MRARYQSNADVNAKVNVEIEGCGNLGAIWETEDQAGMVINERCLHPHRSRVQPWIKLEYYYTQHIGFCMVKNTLLHDRYDIMTF